MPPPPSPPCPLTFPGATSGHPRVCWELGMGLCHLSHLPHLLCPSLLTQGHHRPFRKAGRQDGAGAATHPERPHSPSALVSLSVLFQTSLSRSETGLERLVGGSGSATPDWHRDHSHASPLGLLPHGLHRPQGPCALPELPGGCVGGGERHPGKNKLGKTSQVQIPAGSVTLGQ